MLPKKICLYYYLGPKKTKGVALGHSDCSLACLFRKQEMIEEKDPNKVNPAEDRDDDTEDKAEDIAKVWFLKDRGHAHKNLNNPVDDWDEEKDELDEAGLGIKPLHYVCPLFY
jgi:hypothetical protein